MKKKLLLPAILLVLVGLGLTLFLSSRDASSQAPTAPIPYPRPEGSQGLHTPGEGTPDQPDPESSTPQNTDTPQTPTTAPEQDSETTSPVADGTIVAEDGSLVIIYNANYDMDVYPDTQYGTSLDYEIDDSQKKFIAVHIISPNERNLREISLDVHGTDAEKYYTYTVRSYQRNHLATSHSMGNTAGISGGSFSSHITDESVAVGMTLAGVDWNEALQRYTHMVQTDDAYRHSPSTPGSAKTKEDARADYLSYLERYQLLASELKVDAPKFHALLLSIDLSAVAPGTTIEEMTLKVDNSTFLLPLGQIRFHGENLEVASTAHAHDCVYLHNAPLIYAWDDGCFTASFGFLATEAMILDRIEVLNEDGTVVSGAWIRQIDQKSWKAYCPSGKLNDTSAESLFRSDYFSRIQPNYWPDSSPFYVNAGDLLAIRAEFFSPALAHTAHYQGVLHYALHYTTAQGHGVITLHTELTQDVCDYNEMYYVYLEGLDLRSYYTYIDKSNDGQLP